MDITIKFNLPEEFEQFEHAMNAEKYHLVFSQFEEYLRTHADNYDADRCPNICAIYNHFKDLIIQENLGQ